MPLGSSLSLPYSPGIRRTHVLYLALLLVVASALGSWIHQYTARSLSPAQGLSVGLPQRLLTPDPASAPALDAARMEHLDGRLDGLQQQLSQLASSLAASSSAASTGSAGSAAAAPPAAPQPAAPAHSAPAARPMVLGMAKGLDAAGVYRFVRSLRTHSPSVDIVIFTDQATLASNELLPWVYKEYGVTVQLFEVAQLPAQLQGYHPSSYRWVLMRDYMRALPAPTGPVFFADVRDTVFQGDLFARLQGQGEPVGFYAFQEQRPGTIAACGWNSGWVKDCFGAEGLSKVGGNVISCSGTSLAGWQDALAYVELMGECAAAGTETDRALHATTQQLCRTTQVVLTSTLSPPHTHTLHTPRHARPACPCSQDPGGHASLRAQWH
jgi:hypothetical protein